MEEKEFMNLDEVARYIGIKRASVYNYMKDLKIRTHKFGRDRRSYIALADAQRMKAYKERPWTVEDGEDTGKRKAIRPAA